MFLSFRRKPARNSVPNKNGSSSVEANLILEDDYRSSPKTLFSSKKSVLSHKQNNHFVEPTGQRTNHDIPPALPPRKPMDKKNSVQMSSTSRNPSALDNSPSQISFNAADDISSSLAPPRILPNKEVSIRVGNIYYRYILLCIDIWFYLIHFVILVYSFIEFFSSCLYFYFDLI